MDVRMARSWPIDFAGVSAEPVSLCRCIINLDGEYNLTIYYLCIFQP